MEEKLIKKYREDQPFRARNIIEVYLMEALLEEDVVKKVVKLSKVEVFYSEILKAKGIYKKYEVLFLFHLSKS